VSVAALATALGAVESSSRREPQPLPLEDEEPAVASDSVDGDELADPVDPGGEGSGRVTGGLDEATSELGSTIFGQPFEGSSNP
jgi:hypothetical protein